MAERANPFADLPLFAQGQPPGSREPNRPISQATGAAKDRGSRASARTSMHAAQTKDLVASAEALVGLTLADIAEGLGLAVPVGNVRTKGWSGQIIESELCTGHPDSPTNNRGPDFSELGIELKTVPVDVRGVPRESTAVCVIDPVAIAGESWATSYAKKKLSRVLFVALEVPPRKPGGSAGSVGDRRVVATRLWSPSPTEEAVLREDFEHIVCTYFRTGRAHQLTGHVGRALQVRPKARSNRDTRPAFDEKGRPIRIGRCGFYLRAPFVAHILQGSADDPPG